MIEGSFKLINSKLSVNMKCYHYCLWRIYMYIYIVLHHGCVQNNQVCAGTSVELNVHV